METNEQGKVALVYYKPIPKMTNLANGKEYFFLVKFGIPLCWVDPEDVAKLTSITITCCGGSIHQAFKYATENQVKVWTNGHY